MSHSNPGRELARHTKHAHHHRIYGNIKNVRNKQKIKFALFLDFGAGRRWAVAGARRRAASDADPQSRQLRCCWRLKTSSQGKGSMPRLQGLRQSWCVKWKL